MWKAYIGLIKKEFIQIFRDRNMLRMIFAMPVIQLLLFGYVVNTDVKELNLDVYNYDQSQDNHSNNNYHVLLRHCPYPLCILDGR